MATDVYLPDADSPLPALIKRTPYDKTREKDVVEAEAYATAGYAVVLQDVRGRYASEGVFVPYQHEAADGLALLAWVRAQPWCDGRVGTFGGSYHGGTQWLVAMHGPEGLLATSPQITFDDLFDGSAYQGGAKVLHDLRWTVADIIPDVMRRAREAGEEVTLEAPEVYGCLDRLPLATDPAVQEYGRYYLDWMSHNTFDDFWRQFSPKLHYGEVTAPALNVSGWYDIFVPSTLRNYRGLRGGSEEARRYTRLVMGPWTHMDYTGSMNGFDFGPEASDEAVGLHEMKVAWFDHWLRGESLRWDPERPVKVFVMGENAWRDEVDWPLPDTRYVPFYLHSDGMAGQAAGALSPAPCADGEPSDAFTYDPFDPVPTVGGQVILPGEGAMGPRDQREVEARPDVLVFETEPLVEPLTVIGPLTARLWVSSDCVDTDFTAKLCDVDDDGVSMLLTDGILRMRYRNSMEEAELMEPDEVYEVEIDIAATANTFLPGHRVRLSVSSSNFPRFNRNSNTGGPIWSEPSEAYRCAHNVVYHDAARPSCLVLPVIGR